ncbi:MAG: hypothetical protein KAG97_08655, partial [Victivallales bacterium]|nr:hypothetical protein [Victivallales bacterium]
MSLILGLDLGTTKVAAVIFDSERGLLEHASIETKADVKGLPAGFAEQNSARIADAVNECVMSLSKTNRGDVAAIGVTGQMHGVVLWNGVNYTKTSHLVTWQDKRCDADGFLAKLAESTGVELKSGFGAATLAWLIRNGGLDPVWRNAGTIMDLLVARLCGLSRAVMDPTLAASWGVFDFNTADWDWTAVDALRIPRLLMPEIIPTGAAAGKLTVQSAENWGVTPEIPVCVALG